jgi:hypothetical protein
MSKFKAGDRVRDVSPHASGLGTLAGTIIGKDEGDNWEISWDGTGSYRINWHDHQIKLLAPRMCELKFINSDAAPKEQVLHVDTASVAPIMAWYGAYYAGDRYRVLVDGVKVEKDQNGELISPLREGLEQQGGV